MKYFLIAANDLRVAVGADNEDAAHHHLCAAVGEIPREICTFTETDAKTASEVGLIGDDE